jgi:hypothetical protein
LLLLFGKRGGVAGRNRPAEVGGEGRALSTAAREDTSSPQKNAYTQILGCFLELDKLRGVGLGTPIRPGIGIYWVATVRGEDVFLLCIGEHVVWGQYSRCIHRAFLLPIPGIRA